MFFQVPAGSVRLKFRTRGHRCCPGGCKSGCRWTASSDLCRYDDSVLRLHEPDRVCPARAQWFRSRAFRSDLKQRSDVVTADRIRIFSIVPILPESIAVVAKESRIRGEPNEPLIILCDGTDRRVERFRHARRTLETGCPCRSVTGIRLTPGSGTAART
jgi:hypothetical protein